MNMDIGQIKNSKEYRLTKIEVLKLYFETKEMNDILLKKLADANSNKPPEPEPLNLNEDKLQIIIEPCDNEPDLSNEILELKSEIEGLNKINNELEQEKEEFKSLACQKKLDCIKYCKEIETLKNTLSTCGEGDLIEKNEKLEEELKELKEDYEDLKTSNIKVYNKSEMDKELKDKYNELVKEHNHALTKLHNIESVFSNLRKLLMPGV